MVAGGNLLKYPRIPQSKNNDVWWIKPGAPE